MAEGLDKLTEFFVSPGFLEEKMWVYLATGLSEGKPHPDEDEVLEIIVRLPIGRTRSRDDYEWRDSGCEDNHRVNNLPHHVSHCRCRTPNILPCEWLLR